MSSMTEWFELHSLAIWTIIVAVLCNISCAILGCFLVLRRMSLLGDAISHAVLPGLVIAYLLTGSLNSWAMAVGAGILGILTSLLTQWIHQLTRVPEDAGMGVVFTSLFAIGVIMISRAASHVDLDPGCVLYGLIEFVPLDTTPVFGVEIPRAVQTLGPALLATILFVTLFWKELKIVSFDPALAAAMGIGVAFVHYTLMAMVAAVTVASFEAVGSILVIAMLIVPAATGHMLSDRLSGLVAWSVVVAVASAILGYLGAVYWNTSVAGMMAVSAGGLFAIAVLFSPKQGLVSQIVRRLRLALRIAREDVLAQLFRDEEKKSFAVPGRKLAAGRLQWLARRQLHHRGDITFRNDKWTLTASGRSIAAELIRTHRLWEAFMSSQLQLPLNHVHEPADRMEHFTDPTLRDLLAQELADPVLDPHGRSIPPLPIPKEGPNA